MWAPLILARTHWRVLAAAVVCAAAFMAGATVSAWRLQAELQKQRAELQKQRASYEARLAAGWEAAHRAYIEKAREADEAADAADRAVSRLRKERDQWQTAYNQAKAADPDCAAWADASIRCPLPF